MTSRLVTSDYSIAACLARFKLYMRTATDLGVLTQARYAYEVAVFARSLGNCSILDVTPQTLLTWNARAWEAGAAPATVRQKHAAVKKFLKYMARFEKVAQAKELLEAFDEMHIPHARSALGQQRPLRVPYSLSRERVDKIHAAAVSNPRVGVRNGAIVTFLWATGVRRAELANLLMRDLDLDPKVRQATVVGKGLKTRVVYFDQDTAEEVARWLADRATWPAQDDTVFLSADDGCRLTPNTVSAIIRECAHRAGLRKEVWTHLFRHTRVTELLQDGMDLLATAEFLGHSDVNTTKGYYHQDAALLRDQYDRAMAGANGTGRRRRRAAIPAAQVEPEDEEDEEDDLPR